MVANLSIHGIPSPSSTVSRLIGAPKAPQHMHMSFHTSNLPLPTPTRVHRRRRQRLVSTGNRGHLAPGMPSRKNLFSGIGDLQRACTLRVYDGCCVYASDFSTLPFVVSPVFQCQSHSLYVSDVFVFRLGSFVNACGKQADQNCAWCQVFTFECVNGKEVLVRRQLLIATRQIPKGEELKYVYVHNLGHGAWVLVSIFSRFSIFFFLHLLTLPCTSARGATAACSAAAGRGDGRHCRARLRVAPGATRCVFRGGWSWRCEQTQR